MMGKNKNKNRVFIAGMVIVFLALILGGYCLSQPQKGYLYFEGEYYRVNGACYAAEDYAGKEPVGEVKRNIARGFWNKSGDSNLFKPGAKIYECPEGGFAVESIRTYMNTGETRLLYWAANPEN